MPEGVHDFVYRRETHRAAATDDYVFRQLIPYIGNKRKLLPLLRRAIESTGVGRGATFLDLFAGSGVVSRMAKVLGFRVISNDWEPYTEPINRCAIACNIPPPFAALGGYHQAIEQLNATQPREGWVTRHLCPTDDERFNPARDRLFFTRKNGMRLDAMRCQIADWHKAQLIDETEQACLLAPLLYQTCYVSNTSGVFKGYHHGWGGRTKTALYRIRSLLELRPALFCDNGSSNLVERQDATLLARQLAQQSVTLHIAYLDPPYNQHPYGSNYHVLNTVTLWDSPSLTEKIEGRNKAAIRDDWRVERRSPYNHRREAERAFRELMTAVDARYLIVSYSTDGTIPLPALIDACQQRGQTTCIHEAYKRYRVSTQRYSKKPLNVEAVMIVDTSRSHDGPSAAAMAESLQRAETIAVELHAESAIDQDSASR